MIAAILSFLLLFVSTDTISDVMVHCGLDYRNIELILVRDFEGNVMSVDIPQFLASPIVSTEEPPAGREMILEGVISLVDTPKENWPTFAVIEFQGRLWILLLHDNVHYLEDIKSCGMYEFTLPISQNGADTA